MSRQLNNNRFNDKVDDIDDYDDVGLRYEDYEVNVKRKISVE